MSDGTGSNTIRPTRSFSRTHWLAVYLAAWLVMLAPILALDTISGDRPFVALATAL